MFHKFIDKRAQIEKGLGDPKRAAGYVMGDI